MASNRNCFPGGDAEKNKKCPDEILNYKDCTGKTPTWFGTLKPGTDDSSLPKQCWNGNWYEQQFIYKSKNGFVEEYYSGEHCYMGSLNVPGTSLMTKRTLGIFYFIFLFWLFLGISVIADIFMEAIEIITSTTKDVDVVDK